MPADPWTNPPPWLEGRQQLLNVTAGVVFAAGIIASFVVSDDEPVLTEDDIRECALDLGAEIVGADMQIVGMTSEPIVAPDGADDLEWTVSVAGDDVVLRLTYRQSDGRIVDSFSGSSGGGGTLDATQEQALQNNPCR